MLADELQAMIRIRNESLIETFSSMIAAPHLLSRPATCRRGAGRR